MNAVKAAHDSIIKNIQTNRLLLFKSVKQNKEKEIKYTKNIDFNNEVANKFLINEPKIETIKRKIIDNHNELLYINKI